ncbi:MAG: hypothetical protein OIF34_08965 [Porticoccaceae bacterium]|nr:hypothetical protein [Porticoccaceae bacterium]
MLERDYYLKTLGIVQYVPREFCVPEAPSQQPVETQPAAVVEAPKAQLSERKAPSIEIQTPEAAPSQPARKAETAAAESDEPLRFAMCHWLIADTLVFSALDYDQNPPQNQHQLLANILRAIGRLSSPLAEPELVQWPLVATAPGGEDEARAMFGSLLRGRAEQSNCQLVLVMGQRASQFLLPDEQRAQGSYGFSDECQLVVTPGLDEMLSEPARKRDTWQLLQPLAKV